MGIVGPGWEFGFPATVGAGTTSDAEARRLLEDLRVLLLLLRGRHGQRRLILLLLLLRRLALRLVRLVRRLRHLMLLLLASEVLRARRHARHRHHRVDGLGTCRIERTRLFRVFPFVGLVVDVIARQLGRRRRCDGVELGFGAVGLRG